MPAADPEPAMKFYSRRSFYLACGLLSLFLLYPLAMPALWDGQRDLRITFRVVDARAHRPIPGAVVHVERGFQTYCADEGDSSLDLPADRSGAAERLVRRCAVYGREWSIAGWSVWRTWNSYTPDWTASATAPGYGASRPVNLLDRRRDVRRGEPMSELEVPIELSAVRPAGP